MRRLSQAAANTARGLGWSIPKDLTTARTRIARSENSGWHSAAVNAASAKATLRVFTPHALEAEPLWSALVLVETCSQPHLRANCHD